MCPALTNTPPSFDIIGKMCPGETISSFLTLSLIAVLILVLPAFLRSNSKLKQFLTNLSIWAIIVLVVMIVSYLVFK